MISVVCVFNDKRTLECNLIASLRQQSTEYTLLAVDNTTNQYTSLPKALNNAAKEATTEYLMFSHQDVYLIGKSWLTRAEAFCKTLGNTGAIGVAGVNDKGESVGFIVDRGRFWGTPIEMPVAAATLDECLVLIPRELFMKNQFDEGFRFHSYVSDLCLRFKRQNLDLHVIPCPVYHNSSTTPIFKAGNIEKDDSRLYLKHGEMFSTIYKTTGTLVADPSTSNVPNSLLSVIPVPMALSVHQFDVDKRVFAELSSGCSFLDLGVIPFEQLWILRAKKGLYSVGVSSSKPYLISSKRLKIHDEYILASTDYLPFQKGSFSSVLIKGLLEYNSKPNGVSTIQSAIYTADRKVVIVVQNNGYPFESHGEFFASVWTAKELRLLGFKTSGLHLRRDIQRLIKVIELLPFMKLILARFFPNQLSKDLLCVKTLPEK
ncbi:MAG: glycosyltransferase family 2 protein [Candidatus Bathyarchaeota archaeon]|nr:glycosyltransferase family 2 protein [Candidatus Bathyarchaeota archaeon]